MGRVVLLIGLSINIFFIFGMSSGMSFFKAKEYYLSSFEGKVIDGATKQPIEGAVVLAVYYRSTTTIAGSNHYPFDAQETLTDKKGEFKIPSKTVQSEEVSGKPKAKIIIFKPGYGAFPEHRLTKAVGENKSWPPPEKHVVYELSELKTREERKENVVYIRRHTEIPYSRRNNYWEIINEERSNLGLPPNTMTEKERNR